MHQLQPGVTTIGEGDHSLDVPTQTHQHISGFFFFFFFFSGLS